MSAKAKTVKNIHQLSANLVAGDAISDFALLLRDFLRKQNFASEIFCISKTQENILNASGISALKKCDSPDNILIYHYSTGSELNKLIKELKSRIVVFYHGVTPPEFFLKFSDRFYVDMKNGIEELKQISGIPEMSFAASQFTKNELINFGFKNVNICPIAIPFEKYNVQPDRGFMKRFDDGKKNILHVSKVFPNKKTEDVIRSFYAYSKYINPDSRLIIAGDNTIIPKYTEYLNALCAEMKVENVVFTGKISFPELIALFKTADVYLHMSEHEGFGVPLVEAMYFGVPVIAYAACAVPETMRGAGILVSEKNFQVIAEMINEIIVNKELRDAVVKKQQETVKTYSGEFLGEYLKGIMEER